MVLKAIWSVVAFASVVTVMGVIGYIENPANPVGFGQILVLAIGLVGGIAALHGLDKKL